MITPFDPSRYTIKPLTREEASAAGHILWVEDADPASALRTMVASIDTPPYNAAVWANAGEVMSAETKALIRKWRETGDINTGHYSDYGALGQAEQSLSRYFNRLGAKPESLEAEAHEALHGHLKTRLGQIFGALPVQRLKYDLRADAHQQTLDISNAHVDGIGALRGNKRVRLLEAIESPGTCLIPNRDAVFRVPPPEYFNYYAKRGMNTSTLKDPDWMVNTEGKISFLQAPAGSLVLITNEAHPWQPILHATPPTPPGSAPQKRTVIVYDFVL